jgi:hypothetical protein
MKLTTQPLTPALWPAFEDLFGENGARSAAAGACIGGSAGAYRKKQREENKAAFRKMWSAARRRVCSPSTAISLWAGVS